MIKDTICFHIPTKTRLAIQSGRIQRLAAATTVIAALCSVAAPAMADYTCPGPASALADSAKVTGSAAACFRFDVPPASPFVRFQLNVNANSMNLFFASGISDSLKDWDRVNAAPIQGETKFVLLQPDPGPYTVAVVPQPGAASFDLSATTGGGVDTAPLQVCDGDICTTALPMKIAAQAIQLGAKFGDRLIFPVNVSAPGKIDVEVAWTGPANRLALILNGPDRPHLSNPVAYYARKDGGSPVKLSYFITADDLKNGKRFRISVVNFSGGEALGDIKITKPKTFLLNIQKFALIQPELVTQTSKILKPATIIQAIDQEESCAQQIQGKIAWDSKGTKQWSPQNLKRLCRGATKAAEPGRCFHSVMHRGVDWGGGSQWNWKNALELCAGTGNANRTVRCFKRRIQKGSNWKQAIRACKA